MTFLLMAQLIQGIYRTTGMIKKYERQFVMNTSRTRLSLFYLLDLIHVIANMLIGSFIQVCMMES